MSSAYLKIRMTICIHMLGSDHVKASGGDKQGRAPLPAPAKILKKYFYP